MSATDPSKANAPLRIRYRLRWWAFRLLTRSQRVCPSALGCWAQFGGELRERDLSSAWCRRNDLVDGRCHCNLINAQEGRP